MWLAEGGLIPGLPELVNPNASTMFWTIVTFVLLLLVLGRFAWRPLLAALEKREKTIQDSLDGAAKLQSDAESLLRDYEGKVASANDDVQRLIDEGRRNAEAAKDDILEKARAEAKDAVDRATREIDLAREQALQDIRRETVDLSVSLASKVIERSLDRGEHEEFIRQSMKDLKL